MFRNQRSQSRGRLQPEVSLYSLPIHIFNFIKNSELKDDTIHQYALSVILYL